MEVISSTFTIKKVNLYTRTSTTPAIKRHAAHAVLSVDERGRPCAKPPTDERRARWDRTNVRRNLMMRCADGETIGVHRHMPRNSRTSPRPTYRRRCARFIAASGIRLSESAAYPATQSRGGGPVHSRLPLCAFIGSPFRWPLCVVI